MQEEKLLEIADQLPLLFLRYGQELANAPVDPDWPTMLRMAALGNLRVVTARSSGLLVGFCFNYLSYPIMYKGTLYGTTLLTWLDKPYREGMNGYRLLKFNREFLESLGCKRLYIASGAERMGMIFQRLGYEFVENTYVRAV